MILFQPASNYEIPFQHISPMLSFSCLHPLKKNWIDISVSQHSILLQSLLEVKMAFLFVLNSGYW